MPNNTVNVYQNVPGLESAVETLNEIVDRATKAAGVIRKEANETVDKFIDDVLQKKEPDKIKLDERLEILPERPNSPSSSGILNPPAVQLVVDSKVSADAPTTTPTGTAAPTTATVSPSSSTTAAANQNTAAAAAAAQSSNVSATPATEQTLTARKEPIVVKAKDMGSSETDIVSALNPESRKLNIGTGVSPVDSWNQLIEGVYTLLFPRIVHDFVHKKDDYARWTLAINVLQEDHPQVLGVKLNIPPTQGWKACIDDLLFGKIRDDRRDRASYVSYESGKFANVDEANAVAAQKSETIVGSGGGSTVKKSPVAGAANANSEQLAGASADPTGAKNSLASPVTSGSLSALGAASGFISDRLLGAAASGLAWDMVTGQFPGSTFAGALGTNGTGAAVGKPLTNGQTAEGRNDAVSNAGEGGIANALAYALYKVNSFYVQHGLDKYMTEALNTGQLADVVAQSIGLELSAAIGGETGQTIGNAVASVLTAKSGQEFMSRAFTALAQDENIQHGVKIGAGYAGSFLTVGLSQLVGTELAAQVGNALGEQLTGAVLNGISSGSFNVLGDAVSQSFNSALANSLGAISTDLTSRLSQAIGSSLVGNAISNGVTAAASNLTGAVGSALATGDYSAAVNALKNGAENALNSLVESAADTLLTGLEQKLQEDALKDMDAGKYLPRMKVLQDAIRLANKSVYHINRGQTRLANMLFRSLGRLSLSLQLWGVDKLFSGTNFEYTSLEDILEDPMHGYVHEQLHAKSQWLIERSKSMLPDNGNSITLVDKDGFTVTPDAVYTTKNGDKIVSFSEAIAGQAIINSILHQNLNYFNPAAEAARILQDAAANSSDDDQTVMESEKQFWADPNQKIEYTDKDGKSTAKNIANTLLTAATNSLKNSNKSGESSADTTASENNLSTTKVTDGKTVVNTSRLRLSDKLTLTVLNAMKTTFENKNKSKS